MDAEAFRELVAGAGFGAFRLENGFTANISLRSMFRKASSLPVGHSKPRRKSVLLDAAPPSNGLGFSLQIQP